MRLAVLALALLFLVVAAPGVAEACPTCARDAPSPFRQIAVVAGMAAVPFAVAASVIALIRRKERSE